jgi:DNA invertase Pin-like site-specific DNA recombinase
MTDYFGYIRVSTAKQGEGVSLDQQRDAINTYAKTHGLSVAGWFEELESASKRGRPVFNKMLAELEQGRARGVIIHKIDRSARHLADWVWVGGLVERGVDVRFVHENIDLTSRGGRLTADMLAVIAADYSRNLRDEVKKGLYGRLKQGLYPWGAPIGYLNRGKGKVKEIDPIAGPLVKLTFELYASGRFTLRSLRREMYDRGLRQPTGRALSLEGLSTLLNNPFYTGIIRIKRTGEFFDAHHTPLSGRTLFDRVQTRLRTKTHTKVLKHEFAFRRLLKCGGCGYALTGERHKGHTYYRCHQTTCRGVSLREEEIVLRLRWFNELIRLSPEDLGDMRDVVEEARGDAVASRAVETARIKREIGQCEDRLARLTDALLDGIVDKETFSLRKGRLLAEKRTLQDRLECPPEDAPAEQMLKKFELANMAYLQLETLNALEIRQLSEKTTSNLVVEGKNLAVTPYFPFDAVAKHRLHRSCAEGCAALRKDGAIFLTGNLPPLPKWVPGEANELAQELPSQA